MSKKSDKVFHLTISVVASVLAVVAGFTILSQKYPETESWFSKTWFSLASSNWFTDMVHHQVHQFTNGSEPSRTRQSNHSTPVTYSKSNGKSTIKNNLVSVETYGTDVPETSVAKVKNLMEQYQIANWVASSLKMNITDNITIILVETTKDYQGALASIGVSPSEAKQMSMDTGGFTQGEKIMIPLYQNQATYDLANTLAHELTHAILNQNVDVIPSWVNEGLAVTNGMNMQAKVENSVAFQGYARQLAESVVTAATSGKLIPLTADESKILQGSAEYDIELQDWLAVRQLLQHNGIEAFKKYFSRINAGESDSDAFAESFGMSETSFNANMTNFFKSIGNQTDAGVQLVFAVDPSYHGYIRVLQHGTQTWRGFRAVHGTDSFFVTPFGSLKGNLTQTDPTYDSTAPDQTTLYVNLDPDTPLVYQGQTVEDCGFAFDYHDGLYGFVNTWISLKNGQTIYSDTPLLFGVQVSSVQEGQSSPLLALM